MNDDLEFIKNFSKISIKGVCETKKVDRANVINGRTSKENIKKVKKGIESEIAKLYIDKEELKEVPEEMKGE